ncbi:MAG: hypothetical protein ACREJP_06375, partial [Candidatus Methylomirabilales bacterium]
MAPAKRAPSSRRVESKAESDGGEPPRSEAFVTPYPPSWVDRLTDWVERLPIPWWLFYLALGAASALSFT